MTAVGLIFSNIHDRNITEMTAKRTMASVPFGGRYRLIDFALSNMVNSGISKVGIITHYNYQSLLDHIGNGKDWDLARRSGGIKILPPFITAYDNGSAGKLYSTRLEAIMGVNNFINRCTEDFVVMSDCDVICNIDLAKVIKAHEESGAELTIVTKKVTLSGADGGKHKIVEIGENNDITDMYEGRADTGGEKTVSANIMVIRRKVLQHIVLEAITHGYHSFTRDVIGIMARKHTVKAYPFDGFYASISSMAGYFKTSMQLLEPEVRKGLFDVKYRPIMTKVRNSAPAKYLEGARVTNSIVADGCIIEGVVENSVLFRGVKVGKGTVVRNSILLQDSYVGDGTSLNCVVTDKNVVIRDGRSLSGHETMPFFIGKDAEI